MSDAILDRPDIISAWALGALAVFVFDGLPFLKGVEASSLNCGVVKENVSLFTLDETKPLFSNQLFDRTLWHATTP